MTKDQIINEIKRTAAANGGLPLGSRMFATETGIREPDWKGKLWARWSDAVREAGFTPNKLTQAYDECELLDKFARLALNLGRLPAVADTRLAVKNSLDFPDWSTFTKHFGGKAQLVAKLGEFCRRRSEYAAVFELCEKFSPRLRVQSSSSETMVHPRFPDEPKIVSSDLQHGVVYLKKSAKFYKIGKTIDSQRRHRELAIQLPERLMHVHEIKTDDTYGIEEYWHKRFAAKRRGGEWFELNAADVAAFKRRKFM